MEFYPTIGRGPLSLPRAHEPHLPSPVTSELTVLVLSPLSEGTHTVGRAGCLDGTGPDIPHTGRRRRAVRDAPTGKDE